MERYFKKPNGDIIQAPENQDPDNLKSWESRFVECDVNGKEVKKEKKAPKPKVKKKAKVDNGE